MNDVIEYTLYPAEQKPVNFRISLDPLSGTYELPNPDFAPSWSHLENNQCSHCPLTSADHELCPLAERVMPFVQKLSHLSSIEEMRVDVTQFDRTRSMTAPVQDILGSLLGLFTATSDCPHTRFLRPMAYFHLPLADTEETVYRVLSMYRMAQFYRKEKTGKAYAGFEKLVELYRNMTEVNYQLSKRMRIALQEYEAIQDGTINAISLLDALSKYVPASIDDAIRDLEPIFDGCCD